MPNYGGKATMFIVHNRGALAASKLAHPVTQLINVPVFEMGSIVANYGGVVTL